MTTIKTPTKPNRLQKIEALLTLRRNWTLQDFEDAYSDEPNRPQTIYEWRQCMSDTLYHTYDEELIDDCLDYEYKKS